MKPYQKPKSLGFLSALMASICCLGPLALVFLGLSGLGLGAFFGKYHLYFILGAAVLLAFAWNNYLKEKTSCETAHCEMKGKKRTRNILILATAVVTFFAGLNLYPLLKSTSCFTCQ